MISGGVVSALGGALHPQVHDISLYIKINIYNIYNNQSYINVNHRIPIFSNTIHINSHDQIDLCTFLGGPPSLSDHMGTPFGPFDSSKASCSEARCHPSSASSGGISRQVSTKATRIGSAHFGGGSAHQGLQMFANTWI